MPQRAPREPIVDHAESVLHDVPKGVSKVVVKKEISHNNYLDITNEKETSIKRDVTSIRRNKNTAVPNDVIQRIAASNDILLGAVETKNVHYN